MKTVNSHTMLDSQNSKKIKKKVVKWRDGTVKSTNNAFNWRERESFFAKKQK
jgi:hypothetical protein